MVGTRSSFSPTIYACGVSRATSACQILRQLVSHPFNVYSFSFIPIRYEETVSGQFVTDQTMIDASSKLRVLDAMLGVFVPAGHRVLIFVQFVEVETSDAFDVDAASSRRLLSLP